MSNYDNDDGIAIGESTNVEEGLSMGVVPEDAKESQTTTALNVRTLTWSEVCMSVRDPSATKKGDAPLPPKKVLDNVWGSAPGKEITAILGPSGAGKTSLLNILSGRNYATSGHMEFSANIWLDGKLVNPSTQLTVRKQIAFVQQDDTLHVAATPREAIAFSARLRLSASTTAQEIEELTTATLKALGLESCADTIIGGEMLKGVSGGERKRASIGVELVTKPSIIFLDEPTSGLDSFSALKVVNVLHTIVQTQGASVLMTIHQPASDILAQIDRLVLLRAGRCMYHGLEDNVTEYFAARNYPIPPKYNPADWIMNVAQTVSEKELETLGYFEGLDEESLLGQTNARAASHEVDSAPSDFRRSSISTQIYWLMKRDLLSIKRNKKVLGSRLMLTTFMSVLTALIFLEVGDKDRSNPTIIQSQFGALIMTWMIAMISTSLPTLIVFPQERPVFLREYSTNHYSVLSYFFSRLCMEGLLTAIQMLLLAMFTKLIIQFQMRFFWLFAVLYTLAMSSTAIAMVIGSTVGDPKMAVEFLPMTIIPQILFAGFFITPDLIPVWLRWLQYVVPLTYSVKIGVAYEFELPCGSDIADINCENVISNTDVNTDDVWWYWLALVAIFVVLRLAALVSLVKKANA